MAWLREGLENIYIHEYNNSSSFCFFYATFANKFVLNSINYLKKFLHKIIQKIIQNDKGYECRRSLELS
jgi:hypothetical protein